MATTSAKGAKTKRKKQGTVVQMPPGTGPIVEPETPFDAVEPLEPAPPDRLQKVAASVLAFPAYPRPKTKGGNVPWEEGIAYWRGLPPEFIERSSFYVIREWPVLDRLQELTLEELEQIRQKKRRPPFKNIDKRYQPFASEDTRMEFLRHYGSGDYKCYFNDIGVTGSKDPMLMSRNLFKFVVSFHDPDFPPILDPSRPDRGVGILDLTHPANQSYIADLRAKGVLPPDKKAGDDEVANEALTKMADKVESLASKVAQGEQDKLVERIDRIAERVGNTGGASSVVEMLRAAKELVTPPAPVASTENAMLNTIVALLNAQIKTTQDELVETRKELRETRNQQMNAPAPKGILEQLVEFAAVAEKFEPLKKILGGFFGGGEAPVRSKMSGLMEFGAEVIQSEPVRQLAAGLNTWLSQPRVNGNGNGHVPMVAVQPVQQQQNGSITPQQDMERFIQRDIVPRMMEAFDAGDEGEDFAEWVHRGWPRRLESLQKFSHPALQGLSGAPAIVAAMKYSPWWKPIPQENWDGLSHREAEFLQFVTSFCAYVPPVAEEEQQQPARPVQPNPDDDIIEYDGEEGEGRES